MRHVERHRTHRIGWLRAAVLGANDGIVSTASLVLGVAAAGASSKNILIAGVAGLMAGAMSMAAGEYVSVSSQADTERADLERERKELETDPEHEHAELTAIYVARGLTEELASQVATELMAHDALGAHARDELGISDTLSARPVQAALASAGTFAVGAALPLLIVVVGAGISAHVVCSGQLAIVSRAIRFLGCTRRRCFGDDFRRAGDLLGCLGDGFDRWRRGFVWSHCMRPRLCVISILNNASKTHCIYSESSDSSEFQWNAEMNQFGRYALLMKCSREMYPCLMLNWRKAIPYNGVACGV